MSGSRPSLFEDDSDAEINLDQFAPRAWPEQPPVPADEMRRLSEASGFPSRAAVPTTANSRQTVVKQEADDKQATTPVRRPARTGRTWLLNARLTQRAHDRFHEIVAAEQARFEAGEIMHKVTLGEVVERALAALDREMGEGRRG